MTQRFPSLLVALDSKYRFLRYSAATIGTHRLILITPFTFLGVDLKQTNTLLESLGSGLQSSTSTPSMNFLWAMQ